MYKCTVEHCLYAIYLGNGLGWYDYKTFAVHEFQHYAKLENGNMHWIIPGKFIAFDGPMDADD